MGSLAGPIAAFLAERESGQDVRSQNVRATQALANIMKSSLGPHGLDKMLVDNVGEMTVTNDGATILKQLEVQHPAAKVLVDLSDLQDTEVGDGTTTVILLAAELIKRGQQLIEKGVHPTWILNAYRTAGKEAVQFIKKHLSVPTDRLGDDVMLSVAKTSMASKLIGGDSAYFSKLVCDSVLKVRTEDVATGKVTYPINAISVLKTHGLSTRESQLVDGFALAQTSRASQGMPALVEDAKIAVLEFPLKQYRAQMGVQILVDEAVELERIRLKEKDIVKERIEKILAAGANVILTSEGIDDLALKYFVEKKCLAVRRVPRKDLRRIAKATKAKVVFNMASQDEDEEHFDPAWLGSAGSVAEERVGDWDYIFVRDCKGGQAATIILRGANDYLVDEVERCVHDAICVVARTLESQTVVAGGGSVEVAASVHLERFAHTISSKIQMGVLEFAEALTVIPKTLAVNAARDATELLADLRAAHYKNHRKYKDKDTDTHTDTDTDNTKDTTDYRHYGLDLHTGTIRDNILAGVIEPSMIKTKAVRFATEAAITILRVDDIVRCYPEQEEPEDD